MTTIVVDQHTAQLLQAIQAKAQLQGVTLSTLLRPLAETGVAPQEENPCTRLPRHKSWRKHIWTGPIAMTPTFHLYLWPT